MGWKAGGVDVVADGHDGGIPEPEGSPRARSKAPPAVGSSIFGRLVVLWDLIRGAATGGELERSSTKSTSLFAIARSRSSACERAAEASLPSPVFLLSRSEPASTVVELP